MRAVEGSLLVVDASQGVEAQTLANVYTALEADHEIFPILNKVDLPASDCDRVAQQIEEVIGLDASSALQISAKTGLGIDEVLEAIVTSLPHPKGVQKSPLKAMLIDSWYDSYLGVVVMIRIVDGILKRGDKIIMMQSGAKYTIDSVGVLKPKIQNVDSLSAGEIGVFTASIKQVRDTRVGDTITHERRPCSEPLAGYEPAKPVVFCGFFPVDSSEFENLRESIEKLALNDSSFTFEIETSLALGFGFRCGFLGLLHLEVIRDRIEREFNIDLITTAPSVVYSVETSDNKFLIDVDEISPCLPLINSSADTPKPRSAPKSFRIFTFPFRSFPKQKSSPTKTCRSFKPSDSTFRANSSGFSFDSAALKFNS